MVKNIQKLLVVALRAEWSHLKQTWDVEKSDASGGLYWLKAHPGTALLQVGAGLSRAKNGFEEFLRKHPCGKVLHFGFCGALDSSLKVGDLFVGRAVSAASDSSQVKITAALVDPLCGYLAAKNVPFHCGTLFSSEGALKDRTEKALIAKYYGARAVDMESYSVACLCRNRQIDYISVRGIFDVLEEDITHLGEPYDEAGDLKITRLTANLIRSPKLILKLPYLKRRYALINKNLKSAIDWFIDA